jgi:hypothetical protein
VRGRARRQAVAATRSLRLVNDAHSSCRGSVYQFLAFIKARIADDQEFGLTGGTSTSKTTITPPPGERSDTGYIEAKP